MGRKPGRIGTCVALWLVSQPMAAWSHTELRFHPAKLLADGAHSVLVSEMRRVLPRLEGLERDQGNYQLGLALRRIGDLEGSRRAFEEIPSNSHWYARSAAQLADVYALEGKKALAAQTLRRLVPEMPRAEALAVRFQLGEELLALRDYDGAIAAFRPLHENGSSPYREQAWYGAGWAATRGGLPERAVWFWRNALQEFPQSARVREARLNLANHYLRLGKWQFAADQLKAVADDPIGANPDAIAILAALLAGEAASQAGDWVRAIEHYRSCAASGSWAEFGKYGLAWALWRVGRLEEAQNAFEEALRGFPHSRHRGALAYGLGRVHQDRGRPALASESYQLALLGGRGRWSEYSLLQLAGLELVAQRPKMAMQWVQRLLVEYPNGPSATQGMWLLGESQLASGALSDAITTLRQLAGKPESLTFLEGRSDRVLLQLGLAYFKSGDFDSAEAAFFQVRPEKGSLGAQAIFWRAESLYRLGRMADASQAYRRIIENHSDSPWVAEATYGLAWTLLLTADKPRAAEAFKKAADRLSDPRLKRDAAYRLALLQMDAARYREAQESWHLVMRLDRGDALGDSPFQLAYSQMRGGELNEALGGFSSIASREKSTLAGRRARSFEGQILMRLGRFPEAARSFEALALESADEPLEVGEARQRAGAAFLSADDPVNAAAMYAKILEDAQSPAELKKTAREPLANAYLRAGWLSQAEAVLLEAATGEPWVSTAQIKVAQAYLGQGKWRQAAEVYGNVNTPTTRVLLERARALRKAGELDNAAAAYEQLAQFPRYEAPLTRSLVLFELWETYSEAGRFDHEYRVLLAIEKVVAVAQKDRLASALIKFGDTIATKGDVVLAETAYRAGERHARKGSPQAWKARYLVGKMLVESRRYQDALFELSPLTSAREPLGADPITFRLWKALAKLKQGEALERLGRWEEARALYEVLGADSKMPAAERNEAQARLAWIKTNVKRRLSPTTP